MIRSLHVSSGVAGLAGPTRAKELVWRQLYEALDSALSEVRLLRESLQFPPYLGHGNHVALTHVVDKSLIRHSSRMGRKCFEIHRDMWPGCCV